MLLFFPLGLMGFTVFYKHRYFKEGGPLLEWAAVDLIYYAGINLIISQF